MIVAAFMTLQQGISDLSCLPTQPASCAVLILKPIFTVSVLHASAAPYSGVLGDFVLPEHSQQEIAGTSCAHNRKTENINYFVSAYRSIVAPALQRSRRHSEFCFAPVMLLIAQLKFKRVKFKRESNTTRSDE